MAGTDRFQLLYVCVANVCRSVLAERLTRHAAGQRAPWQQPDWLQVASAGTEAVPGRPLHPYLREILHGYGADGTGFASRRLTAALVHEADLVLAATAIERDRAIAMVPSALWRIFTIREFGRLAAHAGPHPPGPAEAVASAHAMRGCVPYADPTEDDLDDPAPTRAGFERCAAELVPMVESVLAAINPVQVLSRRCP